MAFASLDEMLSPDTLAMILGRPVASVRREPLTPAGWSSTDATFESVYIDGQREPSLVSKTVDRGRDWVAVATGDEVDREVRVWESGLLDRIPGPAAHAVVAGARSETSYSLLMRDVSGWLLPRAIDVSHPADQQFLLLDALAAMHAEFWMDDSLKDPFLGLSSLAGFIGQPAQSTMKDVRTHLGSTAIVEIVEDGWDKLPSLSDPNIAADIQAIADDPTPVVEAASRFPWTLTHTDVRPDNVAIDTDKGKVYLLDWARPALAPPALDLVYWLVDNQHIPVPHDEFIDMYAAKLRSRLGSRFSTDWWSPQLDLCFVVIFATMAPFIAHFRPDDVAWWAERAQPGMEALG